MRMICIKNNEWYGDEELYYTRHDIKSATEAIEQLNLNQSYDIEEYVYNHSIGYVIIDINGISWYYNTS